MELKQTSFPCGVRRAGLLAAAVGLLLAPALARAQSVTLTFLKPEQSVFPNGPVTFFGTITNNSRVTETLTGFDFGGLGQDFGGAGLTADATPFFNITPLQLTAGQSTGFVSLFTVTETPGTLTGSYVNEFDIEGGTDPTASDLLGGAQFTVDAVAPVPETSTAASFGLLLLSGAAVLVVRARRKSSRA